MPAPSTPTCPACAAPLRVGAAFCGACGAALVGGAASALALPPGLRLAVDAAAARDFAVGHRCLLRLRVDSDGPALTGVRVAPSLSGGALSEARVDVAAGGSAIAAIAFSPEVPGQHDLAVTVSATAGADAFVWRFGPVHLRIRDAQSPSVNIVNIDQSAARVIDNSRATFAPDSAGGLLTGGDWQALERTSIERVATAPAPRPKTPERVDFTVTTARASYRADALIARGELTSVFAAHGPGGDEVALKIASDRADNDLLLNEARVLERLHGAEHGARRHLPRLLDQFKTSDGRVGNVLDRLDGMDLTAIRERLPGGVPARHLVWIMRRCLATLGWAHARGVLHGNVDPAHILVRPHDHMVWVVDWCYGVVEPATTGDRFKALNEIYSPPEVADRKAPVPASDLYALGKTLIFAAGGDPKAKTLPDEVDERFARLLRFLVVESARGRAQDAWQLYLEVDRVREQIWGPHKFEPFDI